MISTTPGRGALRWVDYARRSMQRLGFVKWLLTLASPSLGQNLESLTRAFYAEITCTVPVPPEGSQALANHIQQQQRRNRREKGSSAEIQDLYLSDPQMPSHTGAITGDLEKKGYRHAVYVEVPTWAVRLRLLRDQNYTQTDRGRVLLLARNQSSQRGQPAENGNPLLLNTSERYVCLFCLLDADGDLLRSMYQRLLGIERFSRAEAGDAAVDALKELRTTRLKHVSAGPSQQIRSRLDRAIAAAEKQSGSGLGPRESIATPRTEPLVDCGLLSKPSFEKYEYSFTSWGKLFLSEVCSVESISGFLELGLSRAMSTLIDREISRSSPTLQTVARPYTSLRSGIGYISLRELAVASVSEAISVPSAELFEISTIEQSLKQFAAHNDRLVRLALGRTGGIAQVRIDQRALKDNVSTD